MEEAEILESTYGARPRLASVSLFLEGVTPAALLHLGEGSPRGFWAREGRWFAHVGEAAGIRFSAPGDPSHRFRRVWEAARDLLSSPWNDPASEVPPPPPRFFGGFSFRDDHSPDAAWAGFPPARFVLPEAEIMGVDGGGILTIRKLIPSGEDPTGYRGELESRLRAFRDALASFNGSEEDRERREAPTREEPDLERWNEAILRALARVDDGTVSKVVMARVLVVPFEAGRNPVNVALALWRANSASHVFLFEPAPGRALLGAAPETVATVEGNRFRATAVAGSITRGVSESERAALARRLLGSEKERWEHRVSVDDMVARLGRFSEEVRAQEEPHVLALPAIQHLETVIEATLRPGETVLSVLQDLHPTPAVCGFPRDRALELIRREELFQRGWYAGPVGWFDGEGNGVFVPALRSALWTGPEWRLFAGAGIVRGSEPRQEWEETRIKFEPVLRALSGATLPEGPGGTGDPAEVSPRRQGGKR